MSAKSHVIVADASPSLYVVAKARCGQDVKVTRVKPWGWSVMNMCGGCFGDLIEQVREKKLLMDQCFSVDGDVVAAPEA